MRKRCMDRGGSRAGADMQPLKPGTAFGRASPPFPRECRSPWLGWPYAAIIALQALGEPTRDPAALAQIRGKSEAAAFGLSFLALPAQRYRQIPDGPIAKERAPMKTDAAIVGVGASAFGRFLPHSQLKLGAVALKAALDDTGLSRDDIDGLSIHIGWPLGVDYDRVAEGLGLNIRYVNQAW